ncbi:MAG: metalloenzyme [Candidatus Kryptoniota bacterium]
MHFLFLFLDGVGIGENHNEINPFFSAKMPNFVKLFGGIPSLDSPILNNNGLSFIVPTDALLGVEGLPQSGTGQTSLFTGVNAARVINSHFGPYPHSEIKTILEEKNIFKVLKELGVDVYFANAYPRQFFEYVKAGKRKLSATTLSCLMSGIPLCNDEALRKGKGISADITGERWRTDLGYSDIEPQKPFDVGNRMRQIAEEHDFTMFEFFLTDHAGHEQDMEFARNVLETFDEFLGGIIERGLSGLTLLISSDHGNVEDLSTRAHTLNPVLTGIAGEYSAFFKGKIHSIVDIAPLIVALFTSKQLVRN